MIFNQRRGSRRMPSQVLHAIGEGLRRRSPRIYRFVKPAWHRAEACVRRLLAKPGYWEQRRDYAYYKEVVRFARLTRGQALTPPSCHGATAYLGHLATCAGTLG